MAKKRIYKFKGTEGGKISDADARKWIQVHQDHHAVKGHFFGREIISKILEQPGCMGIRMYHAIDDKSKKVLVLIGADAKGDDMWSSGKTPRTKLAANDDPGAADMAMPCPPWCSSK